MGVIILKEKVHTVVKAIDLLQLCLVAWPSNGSELGVDLVLVETSLLFLC